MTSIDEIINFLEELSGSDDIAPTSVIFNDIGMVGDDFHEMIENFSTRYSVDMTGYLWYFHSDEEGQSIGEIFFKPPYRQVDRIPVTPTMLVDFANKGKWDIRYPIHKISPKRNDLLINKVVLTVFATIIVILFVIKYLK